MKVEGWISVLLLGAALLVAEEARGVEKELGRCHGLRVGAADSPGGHGGRRRTPVLSAAEAKDLAFELSVSEDAASTPIQVKLFTPRGRLYQVLDAVAEEGVSSERDGRRRRSPRHARSFVARFPVAGTQVTTYALFGEWRAEVYLDGAETPCTRPLEFVLDP